MYNLELEKIAREIKDKKAKIVLIQLPDGLKPQAEKIVEYLEKNTKAEVLIWFESCFGACDLPSTFGLKIDLVVQFGHNKFIKTARWDK